MRSLATTTAALQNLSGIIVDFSINFFSHLKLTIVSRNFRSHEKLLKLPSTLFYCDQLETAADELVVNSLLQWPSLKKKGFPLIFHGIIGQDLREENSPSFFNLEEVKKNKSNYPLTLKRWTL